MAVGSGWRLVVGRRWRLVVVGGWRLVGVGGWRLVVPWGGPEGRSLTKKKKTGSLRTALPDSLAAGQPSPAQPLPAPAQPSPAQPRPAQSSPAINSLAWCPACSSTPPDTQRFQSIRTSLLLHPVTEGPHTHPHTVRGSTLFLVLGCTGVTARHPKLSHQSPVIPYTMHSAGNRHAAYRSPSQNACFRNQIPSRRAASHRGAGTW